jgi:hypothetical protein
VLAGVGAGIETIAAVAFARSRRGSKPGRQER